VDVYSVLKPVCAIWDNSQHAPLGIFIYVPLSRHAPWRLGHTQPVVDLARALREVPDDDFVSKWHLLSKFLCLARQLEAVSEAWCGDCYTPPNGYRFPVRLPKNEEGNLLMKEEDNLIFAVTRPGDHLFCPFKCEICHFRNIQGRSPNMGLGPLEDTELMKSLRRVSVGAFWSGEPTTLSQNLEKGKHGLQDFP
jgi:hypothetical protein